MRWKGGQGREAGRGFDFYPECSRCHCLWLPWKLEGGSCSWRVERGVVPDPSAGIGTQEKYMA